MQYSKYAHLLDKNYSDGVQDCLALVLDFYKDVYGLEFPNYARPLDFYLPPLDLAPKIIADMQFLTRPLSRNQLTEGDMLGFRCNCNYTNHYAIYVGNNLFIHHMRDGKSREEALDQRWFRRLTHIHYHEDIQKMLPQKHNWFELLINK